MLAVLLALPAADFISGVVHWSADTWGNEQWPVIGERFLRPFRVHHIAPEDLCRRSFLDCNGDVAMLCVPVLFATLFMPNVAGLFLVAFCAWTLPTNQIHKWAHLPTPPRFVRALQCVGLILRTQHHSGHHTSPYTANYCIVNGWCNPLLNTIDFWRRAERTISRITGLTPREDEIAIIAAESTPEAEAAYA
jgi:hypothetical protein